MFFHKKKLFDENIIKNIYKKDRFFDLLSCPTHTKLCSVARQAEQGGVVNKLLMNLHEGVFSRRK